MWIFFGIVSMYLLFNTKTLLKLVRNNNVTFKKVSYEKQKKILRKKYNCSWGDRYIRHIIWCQDNLYKTHEIPTSREKECKDLIFKMKYSNYKILWFLRKCFHL